MDSQLSDGFESMISRLAGLSPEKRKVLEKLLATEKVPIARAAEIGSTHALPVSFAQQRLWFLDQLIPASPVYNIPYALRLTFPVAVSILRQSLNEIVRRHEALRTTFTSIDGEPVQVINPQLRLSLEVTDLRDLPATEREAEAIRLATAEGQQPFDLAHGPLVRTSLLRLAEADYVFLLTMHHIVTDGWSMNILFEELTTLYGAYAQGRPSPLPELPIQYADYAVWQREWLQGEVLEAQVNYWREQLRDVPLLQLPTDRSRPAVQTFRGAKVRLEINPTLVRKLRQLSQREGATSFMMMLAAFKVLLYRQTGQDDIVVGSPIAGRNRAEIESLIGFFVNTLVLRTRLDGEMSFPQVLARVREVCLGAYAHQEVPFEILVERLRPDRELNRNPLFQVMLQLQSSPKANQKEADNSELSFEINRGTAIFDMAVNLWETGDEIKGEIEYNTDLFDGTTIERLAGHFRRLLEAIVAQPEQQISQLPLLSEREKQQVLHEWNETAAEYPRDVCIHQLFEAQVERTPEAVAVVFGAEQISYAELNRRANQLAHYLQQQGVGVETLVGVMVARSVELVVSLLAVLKTGAAYVPLDPGYPRERLKYMIEDAGIELVVTQGGLVERLGEHQIKVVRVDEQGSEIGQQSVANVTSGAAAENLAYVIYTSGSTGKPKGALGTHRAALNRFSWMWQTYPFERDEICCQKTSSSFVDSIWEIFGPLLQGVATVIIPDEVLKDPYELIDELAQRGITRLVLVPSLLRVILDAGVELHTRLPRLKFWTTSGEALPVDLSERFLKSMPERVLLNLFGSSEVAADATWHEVRETQAFSSVPIGRPIANTQVYIVDAQLQPVPVGVTGQLLIGGAGLARGYLDRPALTAEKFIPHPYSNVAGARLYDTGDLARFLNDGNIEFLGRADHQVKIRGFRIELGEIETLLNAHLAVHEAVVAALEEESGDKRLVAYVVAESGSELLSTELRSYLWERLPEHMTPATYVMLEQLPLTPNGKVDRRALPRPDTLRPQIEVAYVAPRNSVEEVLAATWSEVLNIERIGAFDNFFTELGGHSLMATQLISRVRDTFKVELPLRRLFETPTIAGLAEGLLQTPGQRLKVERIAQLLIELEQLSPDEVESRLLEKTSFLTEGGTNE